MIRIYGGAVSPFVMRPVLAARAKGHEISPEPFDGGSKSDAYLALSPMGKVPLLVDGDFALPESQVIVDYLDSVLPGPSLLPADLREAARARLVVRIADCYIVPELGALFGRDNPDAVAPAIARIAAAAGHLEHFRRDADVFAVGDSFSIADAALIPLCFFFDALDKTLGTAVIIADRPRLAAWWAHAKASELGSRALAEQAAGLKVMLAARR